MLAYPPFAAVVGIVNAGNGGHPLKLGQSGTAVSVVQGALIDLGASMPRTLSKFGKPDGVFGQETFTAVKAFQSKNGLADDGVAGKDTIRLLDRMMVNKAAATTPPIPVVAPPAPRTSQYQLGTADPPRGADPGAGRWNAKPVEAVYAALKLSIINILPHAAVTLGDDAAKHMAHYLGNSGRTYTIDLEDMLEEVPSAREALEIEAAQAQELAEQLPVGTHKITSVTGEGGYNTKEESWNWFYAIGGYTSWGKGEVTISDGPAGREYVMDFEYKFYDRYNWDKGKKVTIFRITITDEFMAEFHRQGLAQEFDCVGSVTRRVSWKHGQSLSKDQFRRPGGRG